MIEALDERGPDSSGIAVYADRPATEGPPTLRLSLGADERGGLAGARLLPARRRGERRRDAPVRRRAGPRPARGLSHRPSQERLAADWPQVRVLGTGWNLRVLKDTGRPTDTCARYGIGAWDGLPGRGPHPDGDRVGRHRPALPPVRPGPRPLRGAQRLVLQLRHACAGVCWPTACRFDSDNDSEVAARYLASRLAARRRPRGGHPLGDEGDGRLLHPGHHQRRRDVGRPRRLRLQAGSGGRDRRPTWPWPRSTGPWPSCPGIADAVVFEPHPEEVYTWSTLNCAETLDARGRINAGACGRCADGDRGPASPSPAGRHNLAVGLTGEIAITIEGNAGYFLGGLCGGSDGSGPDIDGQRVRRAGRSARTSWAAPSGCAAARRRARDRAPGAGASSSRATPRCGPASPSRAAPWPSPATPAP